MRGPSTPGRTRAVRRALAVGALVVGVGSYAFAATREPRPRPDRLGVEVAIEDPSGRVLPRLHRALAAAARGEGVARLAFWGASHTSSDGYPGALRSRLQARFGDGGRGLVLPAVPFARYAQRGLRFERSEGWTGVMVRGTARTNDAYGRAGFAVDTEVPSWSRVVTDRPIRHVELWARPGGEPALEIDGAVRDASVTLRSPTFSIRSIDVDSAHEIVVRTHGPLRAYGLMLESGTPGVIVESFGVPSARVRDQLPWDESSLREQLAERPPDLVALAYGTNETRDILPLDQHVRAMREILARWRRIAPDSACLLIGPSDWPERVQDRFVGRPRTTAVRDAYRAEAFRAGCAFFDLVRFQGGPASMPRWITAGLVREDRVHFTPRGHDRLGEVLESALLDGYPRRALSGQR